MLRAAGIICCLLALTLAVTSYSGNQYQAYRFIESHQAPNQLARARAKSCLAHRSCCCSVVKPSLIR